MSALVQLVTAWWLKWFPSPAPAPAPEPPEIPGREALFQQLESLRQQQASESAMRSSNISRLTQELNAAQNRIDEIQTALTVQHRLAWQEGLEASNEIERVTAAIIAKAPLSLGMFIEEIDGDLSQLRTLEPTIIPNGSDRNYTLMKKTMRFQTNAGSIKKRVAALQTARERAVAMLSENLSVKEITSEWYRLRRELPEIKDEETRGAHAAMILS